MNIFSRLIIAVTLLLGLLPNTKLLADDVEINETTTNGFVHPGIGLTKGMLDNVREQVRAKREPWYSSYNRFARDPNSRETIEIINQSKSDPSKPNLTKFNDRTIMKQLEYDARRAYRQALMFYFTGKPAHRANAMTIIRLWSQVDPRSFASFHSSHIHTPYAVKDLVSTAELMRYTDSPDAKYAWTDEDTANLTRNLLIPSIDTFMYSNGWFMNQNGYPLAGAMACFIFMNDRENYEKRVEWFTVNRDAPNKGYSSSIQDMFRLVTVDASTRRRVKKPFVQHMEMGRDQAHAGGDLEIACNTARMMYAQGTKVDPVTGTVSRDDDAVGAYEFLDNRILAAANYFSRFMLGYKTPWVPSPSDIESNGKVKQIYYRLSDNYRGRIRELLYWDLYYYYTYKKQVDVGEVAPYFLEAFEKRVGLSDFEWLFIPPEATGEGARIVSTEQEPDVVEIVQRSTHFGNASVEEEEGQAFLRLNPSEKGKGFALLSIKTPSKTIGLKFRTTGDVTLELVGFAKPWLLPNTQGQWRYAMYSMAEYQHVKDILYVLAKGDPKTRLDLAHFVRKPDGILTPLSFATGDRPLHFHTYVGAPVAIDFSAEGSGEITYNIQDLPAGSELDATSGRFRWSPKNAGRHAFVLGASNRTTVAARHVAFSVAQDRSRAMKAMRQGYNAKLRYTKQSSVRYLDAYKKASRMMRDASDEDFWEALLTAQQHFHRLELLTPTLDDGSVNYPAIVAESSIGDAIGFLIDGNDDTFPVLEKEDPDFVFDFGEDHRMSFSAFSLEGRMNFDDRSENTVFYGSNDRKEWVQLTKPSKPSSEMVTMRVPRDRQRYPFRYLQAKRAGKFLEPAELRIFGVRHEAE